MLLLGFDFHLGRGPLLALIIVWAVQAVLGIALWIRDRDRVLVPHGARRLFNIASFGGAVPLPGLLIIQLFSYLLFRLWVAGAERTSARLRGQLEEGRRIIPHQSERNRNGILPLDVLPPPTWELPNPMPVSLERKEPRP